MTFPKGSTTTLVMIANGTLVWWYCQNCCSFRKKELKIWKKWPSVGVGALAVAVAITIFLFRSHCKPIKIFQKSLF